MTDRFMLNRRQLLKTSAAGAALGLASASFPISRAFAAAATVGFIYVGPKDDYGYNQAHAEAAAALKKMPGLTVVEEEKVPETGKPKRRHILAIQPKRIPQPSHRP